MTFAFWAGFFAQPSVCPADGLVPADDLVPADCLVPADGLAYEAGLARALAEQAPADRRQADGLLVAGLDASHVSELVPLTALHPTGPGTHPNPFHHHPPHPPWLKKWFLELLA